MEHCASREDERRVAPRLLKCSGCEAQQDPALGTIRPAPADERPSAATHPASAAPASVPTVAEAAAASPPKVAR